MTTNFERMTHQDLSEFLPTDFINHGYSLKWFNLGKDPTILYHNHSEVYRWEYIPTMGEVWEILKTGGK
uniref:Uncharacterized protein n=1 Tax=viral metagenome TaxID=1070528 RepID=A0A6M3LRK6_9ZZZZ